MIYYLVYVVYSNRQLETALKLLPARIFNADQTLAVTVCDICEIEHIHYLRPYVPLHILLLAFLHKLLFCSNGKESSSLRNISQAVEKICKEVNAKR